MEHLSFEEVWHSLRQLEGRTILTPLAHRRNKIIRFEQTGMIRQAETPDRLGWGKERIVPVRVFRNIWKELHKTGRSEYRPDYGWRIAAACFAGVRELGVVKVKDRPITLSLRPTSQTDSDKDMDEFGEPQRIVAETNICSGKPTIKGTRIMVSNILGMLAGGYSINRILKAYPELSRLDVVSAVEYAARVVDKEGVGARR